MATASVTPTLQLAGGATLRYQQVEAMSPTRISYVVMRLLAADKGGPYLTGSCSKYTCSCCPPHQGELLILHDPDPLTPRYVVLYGLQKWGHLLPLLFVEGHVR